MDHHNGLLVLSPAFSPWFLEIQTASPVPYLDPPPTFLPLSARFSLCYLPRLYHSPHLTRNVSYLPPSASSTPTPRGSRSTLISTFAYLTPTVAPYCPQSRPHPSVIPLRSPPPTDTVDH